MSSTAEQLHEDPEAACGGSRAGEADLQATLLLHVFWCSQQPAAEEGHVQLVQGHADTVSDTCCTSPLVLLGDTLSMLLS